MEWLNIRTSFLHDPAYIGSSPSERATWLCVLLWAAQQELGGRVQGAARWSRRQWEQSCGVTFSEIRKASKLLIIDGDDVVIVAYPIDKEQEVKARRSQAKEAIKRRWEARQAAQKCDTPRNTSRITPRNTSADTEGEGEGEGERNKKEKENKYIATAPAAALGELFSEAPKPEADKRQDKPAKRPRERDPLFDTLAEAEGSNVAELTAAAAKKIGTALAQIRHACADLTADEIRQRAARYRHTMPGATLTAHALALHWSRLGSPRIAQKPRFRRNEPIGWKAWLNQNLPDCVFAANQEREAHTWEQLSDEAQKMICEGIRKESQ